MSVNKRISLLFLCGAGLLSQGYSPVLQAEAEQSVPYYEQNLALLKDNEGVRPAAIPVHPVTAAYNREAIIPPMCYTRTEGQYNPCYVCHQNPQPGRENTLGDGALQVAYSFSDLGLTNHWKNLFEDRSERVAKISDAEITDWINQDNYSELAPRLREAEFKGWIPDLENLAGAAAAFDNQGFARDGSDWIAFNYKPFPSTFWPTNGSTDDVMIRLAPEYRSDSDGKPSRDIYLANLAVTEANLKELDAITTFPVDEARVGKDLDGDGKLGVIERITVLDGYLGKASNYFLQRGTYPQGTEFLHTVRYVGVDAQGDIGPSRRMKEVRYLKKQVSYPLVALREYYREEGYSKDAGYLPGYARLGDFGLDNGMGWSVSGFIEDRHGRLRAYTFEENLSCMGCHNSIGSTIDKTFAFPRKPDGAAGYGYIDLKSLQDVPNRGETEGEYLTYLSRVGGGGEFRSNPEMQAKWFDKDGGLKRSELEAVASIYDIITPSLARALELNKAYRVIVEDQDYIYGKDATVVPPHNVYDLVDNETSPTLPFDKFHDWDIRLDWRSALPGQNIAQGH
ncbi:hypothetical protein [Haliea sp. E17]|uniref:hypothetical protein n=1 Tax=Haliea sp. E17 TaxID=3401576 RepID=UPI003AAD202E